MTSLWTIVPLILLPVCLAGQESILNVFPTARSAPCICGVFLSGQFTKGSSTPPKGNPVIQHDYTDNYICNTIGQRQCANKCLEVMVKHLPSSPNIICGASERDCVKERAYLFIKNCQGVWTNTNFSAGREYCCKNNAPYKCPP